MAGSSQWWKPILLAALLLSCSSTRPPLVVVWKPSAEAASLKQMCAQKSISTREVRVADSLQTRADSVARTAGGATDAFWMDRLAISYYKLALTAHELQLREQRIRELEKSLSAVRLQLGKYRDVISELENMSGF